MRINEWSVMDSRNVDKAIRQVGIRLPHVHFEEECSRYNRDGFTCNRGPGHTGRHAAQTGDGTLVAVWS